MSKPAFPQPIHGINSSISAQDLRERGCDGISQRRLLAGIILSGWLAGNHANPNSEAWKPSWAVKEAIEYADELIKQTEET